MPRILVVDDDDDIRQWLASVLVAQGFDVGTQSRSGDLVRTLAMGFDDLVLLDYHMADKNGLMALREVKAAGISTPVVVMSADHNQQVAVECFRAGAADFIAKPIDPDYLRIIVNRVLSTGSVTLRNMSYRALGYAHHKDDCQYQKDGTTCTCGLKEVFEAIQDF